MPRELDPVFGQATHGPIVSLGISKSLSDPPPSRATAAAVAATLLQHVHAFEAGMGPDREVTVQLANFGKPMQLTLTQIGYAEPSMVVLHGHTLDGKPLTVVQQVGQVNFALGSTPRVDVGSPRRPIALATRAA